jgi:hypothetical protein
MPTTYAPLTLKRKNQTCTPSHINTHHFSSIHTSQPPPKTTSLPSLGHCKAVFSTLWTFIHIHTHKWLIVLNPLDMELCPVYCTKDWRFKWPLITLHVFGRWRSLYGLCMRNSGCTGNKSRAVTAWWTARTVDTLSDTNSSKYRAQANPSSPQYQSNKGTNQCNSVSSGNTRSFPENTNTGDGHTRAHNISYIHLNHWRMSRQGNHVKTASNM